MIHSPEVARHSKIKPDTVIVATEENLFDISINLISYKFVYNF
jgi:hypothetical protein